MNPELKQQIEQYFQIQGVSQEVLPKAIKAIENAAHNSEKINIQIYQHYRDYITEIGLKIGDDFYYSLASNFASRHYNTIVAFIKKYEKEQSDIWESAWSEQQEIESILDKQRRNIFHDDYEYCDPPGEVIIYSDRIEIHAFDWCEGFKESLPKGGKYQGKGSSCWHYPISMKEVFTQSDTFQSMPVLYAEGVENPYNIKP